MQSLITSCDFSTLSSLLSYQLSGTPVNWRAVLRLLSCKRLLPSAEDHLMDTLTYLEDAYARKKRKLGPLSIIHPIRTALLLSKASNEPSILDLLTALLHDKEEDITEEKCGKEEWEKLETMYLLLISRIDCKENWYLNERINFLTRVADERYQEYLSKIIRQSKSTPELIRVKLVDRLDNTLDLRMDLNEDRSIVDCYQLIFEVLFVDAYKGPVIRNPHHAESRINGASRLYELFKNAVFLSLLRSEMGELDEPSQELFDSLAISSINEAKNIMFHIFAYHIRDPQKQRTLLFDVMNYTKNGGVRHITARGNHRLDGLFIDTFDHKDKDRLKKKLDDLYDDKELMTESAVAFAAIFSNFLNKSDFKISGISADGIRPIIN